MSSDTPAPRKRTRKGLLGVPVEGAPRAPRKRRPSGPQDIDDDTGRRPAMTYGEWRASKEPAPTIRARQRVRQVEPRTPPMPVSSLPVKRARRVDVDRQAAIEQGNQLANRQAYLAAHGKPSVVGRTAGGAAGGAAAGAAVAGAPGAAVGGALGGVGGAVGGTRAKRAYKRATTPYNPAKRILLAELAVCATVAALAPIGDARKDEAPGAWMKRMAAILGVFFVLGLVSAMGRGGAKVAAGFGGLVTVVLIVSRRDVFVQLARTFTSTKDKGQGGPGPSPSNRSIPTELGNTEVNPTGAGGSPSKSKPRRVQ